MLKEVEDDVLEDGRTAAAAAIDEDASLKVRGTAYDEGGLDKTGREKGWSE